MRNGHTKVRNSAHAKLSVNFEKLKKSIGLNQHHENQNVGRRGSEQRHHRGSNGELDYKQPKAREGAGYREVCNYETSPQQSVELVTQQS